MLLLEVLLPLVVARLLLLVVLLPLVVARLLLLQDCRLKITKSKNQMKQANAPSHAQTIENTESTSHGRMILANIGKQIRGMRRHSKDDDSVGSTTVGHASGINFAGVTGCRIVPLDQEGMVCRIDREVVREATSQVKRGVLAQLLEHVRHRLVIGDKKLLSRITCWRRRGWWHGCCYWWYCYRWWWHGCRWWWRRVCYGSCYGNVEQSCVKVCIKLLPIRKSN